MRIPLIEELTAGPIPAGSNLLVEYDAASQWYNASLTIAAGWIKTGGIASYASAAQLPDNVRSKLARLGLDVQQLEADGRLEIIDWYTATLGLKSKEKFAIETLKVADLSIMWTKQQMGKEVRQVPECLILMDNLSFLSRFNDKKAWVEFELTRDFPAMVQRKVTGVTGLIRGIHSDWVYKRLEAAVDGVVDFKLDETGERTRTLMRIRNMHNVGFDSKWYPVKVTENFEATLEK